MCVRARVCVCVCACVRACVRAYMRACVCVCNVFADLKTCRSRSSFIKS